jgi:mycothiol synthase
MEVRPCVTDDDYDAWRRVRIVVIPGERCDTVAEMRRQDSPHRLLLLASLGGSVVGSGVTELYTWTQAGNTSMLRLDEHLGYVTGKASITLSRTLPL